MKFHIIEHEQRSPAWFLARSGRITGSRAGDILAKGKGAAESVTRRDYRLQLAAERLTGTPQEDVYVNAAMQWGIDQEANAFAAYEAATGEMVRRTGFLCAEELMVGCSLDGDIEGFDGILELKCPKTSTHLSYLKAGVIPAAYMPQLLHNLWVTEAAWCDFVSFDPRLPPALRLFRQRLYASDADLNGYSAAALAFLAEVEAEVKNLNSMQVAVA